MPPAPPPPPPQDDEPREERGEVGVASVEGGVPGRSQSLLDDEGEEGEEGEAEGEGVDEFAAAAAVVVVVEFVDAFALANNSIDPSPPSPLAVDAGSPAADSRAVGSDWLPEASEAAGGAAAAGVRSVRAPSNSGGVARRAWPLAGCDDDDDEAVGIVADSPPPSSLAAASSISPNKKFHRDAILAQSVGFRLGIRETERCEKAGWRFG